MNDADLRVGFDVPMFERGVDFANWNRYAAVNDEFVPIHMDDEAGREAGYPTAFGMGNLHVAFLSAALRDWLGDSGRIVKLSVQFRQPSVRGIVNRAGGVITSVLPSGGGSTIVELDVWVVDGDGTQLTPGTATVELPAST